MKLICKALEDVERGEIKRLMINMPPRHGKSMSVTESFPSWFLGRHPDRHVIEVSYGASLARKFGRANRQKVEVCGGPIFGVRISKRQHTATNWALDDHAGGMISAGIGGTITGEGADLLLVDDPTRNRRDAESQTVREFVWNEWTNTMLTRLSPGGAVIVIMTRWHEDDLAGRILADDTDHEWTVLSLPCRAESEDDPLGRALGETLWPEHGFGDKWAKRKERDVGPRAWASLYQGRPSPDSGNLFKREYFRKFRIINGVYELITPDGPQYWPAEQCKIFSTCDTAAETKSSSDYFVNSTWALTPQGDLLLLDVFRTRIEGPDQPALMWQKYHEYRPLIVGVEKKITGINLLQDLVRGGMPAIDLNPASDKYNRAVPAGARYKMGKIYHLAGAPWLPDYEKELVEFPYGAHDDQVDCTSYAVQLVTMDYFSQFFNRPGSGAIII